MCNEIGLVGRAVQEIKNSWDRRLVVTLEGAYNLHMSLIVRWPLA